MNPLYERFPAKSGSFSPSIASYAGWCFKMFASAAGVRDVSPRIRFALMPYALLSESIFASASSFQL